MLDKIIGKVSRIIGPIVELKEVFDAQMLELVEIGDDHLVGEIVHLHKEKAVVQVYEDTTGLKPGATVYGQGMPLSLELGPGLIGAIYDGIQRPLELMKNISRQYCIQKGIHLPSLDRKKRWTFKPTVKKEDIVSGGSIIGIVPENDLIEHKIMVPPDKKGKIEDIVVQGEYTLNDIIGHLKMDKETIPLRLFHRWPVRKSRPFIERKRLSVPLITGQRVIDTLFPIAKGGTVAMPGGFGTGKTSLQHQIAKWCDAEIIIYIGCGERGNEMTDVLINFPKLIDPRTNQPLLKRTIFIANTSNMPVAAREASIYTGITLAEYYRDMGYHVAVMADSTSRWAEALRELSGRMEEMPADEGFPAYLPSRLAEFYERAGMVRTLGEKDASITIIGSISPPGGDFSEPVTQHTKRFVRCFWVLDRDLANGRHYPAVSWLDSYSEYIDDIGDWWELNVDSEWKMLRNQVMDLLQRETKLQQVVKLVGPDVLPDTQRLVLECCKLFKEGFLQQNAFEKEDMFSVARKQIKMLKIIVMFYVWGLECLKKGVPLVRLKKLKIYNKIIQMKLTIPNEETEKLDELLYKLEKQLDKLGGDPFYAS
ncbi:V-type ATP synthase subunit A [bacterium]|nr:V-type ATP synthase subunit A [bacterium]